MKSALHSEVNLEQLLDRVSKETEQAEVYYVQSHQEPVLFEANRLKLVETKESYGVALRIIKDGRIGLSSTSNFDDTDGLIRNTLEVAKFGPEARLSFPSNTDFSEVPVYNPATTEQSIEAMTDLGQEAIANLREYNPEVLCDASVSKGVATMTLLNSAGGYATYTKTFSSVYLHGTIINGTDMLFVNDGESSCHPILDTSNILASIKTQLEYSKEVVPAPVGQVPVIFTPHGFAGALLSPLLAGFNGKTVLQKASPLQDKLGEQLLDPRLSIWDDPTVAYSPGSRMCDDEGVPSAVLPLIDGGVIANFLYDLQTAAQAGVESTGSADRGVSSPPSPGTSVVVVAPGDVKFGDMIKGMKEGLVVERLLGAGQSNILGGDFNANVLLGYRISNGNVTGRVKNTVISGNVCKVLKNIAAIENNSHWIGGSLKVPALLLDNVSVATKN